MNEPNESQTQMNNQPSQPASTQSAPVTYKLVIEPMIVHSGPCSACAELNKNKNKSKQSSFSWLNPFNLFK